MSASASIGARLEMPLTMTEAAELAGGIKAGWTGRRMKRHLMTLDEQLGGMLLRKSGGKDNRRYTVTLAALKRVDPDLLEDTRVQIRELSDRVESVEARQDEQDEAQMRMATTVGVVREAVKRTMQTARTSSPTTTTKTTMTKTIRKAAA